MLGYAEPSAFTRACQRWFGLAPRDVRKRLAS
jgi:AraC-like DNA-binding protein